MTSFKTKYTLEQRSAEALKIRTKYPDRVPVVVERSIGSSLSDIDKKKFLVPGDMTVAQFICVIRKRIKLLPEEAIFIFVDSHIENAKSTVVIPPASAVLSNLYEEHKSPCGFLLVTYTGENVYGCY
jgi:GABA(A) receptor-associated protein